MLLTLGSWQLLNFLILALVPLATSLLIPAFTYSIVQEKQLKLRALASMMGLRPSQYVFNEWLFDSLISHCTLTLFWCVGCLFQLRYFVRSALSLFLIFQVWAQLQIALSFLASCVFNRTRPASIVLYLLVVFSALGAFIVWVSTEGKPIFYDSGSMPLPTEWPWQLDIYPPFAYYHAIFLCSKRQYDVADMGSGPMGSALGIMLLSILIVYPLAFYLDATLPREFGVPQQPLFFLDPLLALAKRGLRSVYSDGAAARVAAMSAKVAASPLLDDVAVAKGSEDSDVAAERAAVESGQLPTSVPIKVLDLRKVYGSGAKQKVAIKNLTFKIEQAEEAPLPYTASPLHCRQKRLPSCTHGTACLPFLPCPE